MEVNELNIVVYCGASAGSQLAYQQAAVELGNWLAAAGHTLVYGGSKIGLMGTLADTVLADGGQAIGVLPTFLKDKEIAHPKLSALYVVDTMAERKQKMLALSDACLALPGGVGTLEEIIEAISWARVGQNDRPCIFFDAADYYQTLRLFFDQMVTEEFLSASDRAQIYFAGSTAEIERLIAAFYESKMRNSL